MMKYNIGKHNVPAPVVCSKIADMPPNIRVLNAIGIMLNALDEYTNKEEIRNCPGWTGNLEEVYGGLLSIMEHWMFYAEILELIDIPKADSAPKLTEEEAVKWAELEKEIAKLLKETPMNDPYRSTETMAMTEWFALELSKAIIALIIERGVLS